MQKSTLFRACATVGLFGACFPVVADVISWFLAENYSPVAHSISNLAVGPSSWLMDAGLWAFAAACIAVAVGLWNWRIEARYWTAALICLVLLGVAVAVVPQVNQYAGTENPGANVHMWAVYAIGILFALVCLLGVPGLKTRWGGLARFGLWLGIAWIVLSIAYYWFVPNGWSGLVERALALMMLVWIGLMARSLKAMAQHQQHGSTDDLAPRHG